MKKQLFFILILISGINCYSQIKYESGYFVNNYGNKINCLIKNVDWKNSPTEFTFKSSEDSVPEVADIKTVIEFGISDFTKYKRFTVDIDRSSEDINHLSTSRIPEFSNEQLFLKILVEGKATLYSYEQGNFRKYFYSVDSSAAEQLIFKSYLYSESEIKENNSFKQQLLNNLKCQKIVSGDLERIKYSNQDLVKIFTLYNECQNSQSIDYEKKTNRDKFNLSLRLGLNSSSLVLISPSDASEIDFGNKMTLRSGIEVESILPFNKSKWALIIEPTFQYYNSNITINYRYYKVDYKSIELPLGIRYYMFLHENSKLYLNGSYVIDFDFNSKISAGPGTYADISSRPNWVFGLGFNQNNKYTFEMRYGLNRDIIKNSSSYSHYRTFSIILGYNIF
ncbi:MAG: hypothetical protein WC780_14465 [Lentimicrobiaceae bacterium]|jgi:hypothetical protein